MGRQSVKPQETLKHLSGGIDEATTCDEPHTGIGAV